MRVPDRFFRSRISRIWSSGFGILKQNSRESRNWKYARELQCQKLPPGLHDCTKFWLSGLQDCRSLLRTPKIGRGFFPTMVLFCVCAKLCKNWSEFPKRVIGGKICLCWCCWKLFGSRREHTHLFIWNENDQFGRRRVKMSKLPLFKPLLFEKDFNSIKSRIPYHPMIDVIMTVYSSGAPNNVLLLNCIENTF